MRSSRGASRKLLRRFPAHARRASCSLRLRASISRALCAGCFMQVALRKSAVQDVLRKLIFVSLVQVALRKSSAQVALRMSAKLSAQERPTQVGPNASGSAQKVSAQKCLCAKVSHRKCLCASAPRKLLCASLRVTLRERSRTTSALKGPNFPAGSAEMHCACYLF